MARRFDDFIAKPVIVDEKLWASLAPDLVVGENEQGKYMLSG